MSNENKPTGTGTPQTMRTIFGIFMIIVYVGVGILFLIGFFAPIYGSWTWLRWIAGVILIIYGVWRAYRQFTGIDDTTGR